MLLATSLLLLSPVPVDTPAGLRSKIKRARDTETRIALAESLYGLINEENSVEVTQLLASCLEEDSRNLRARVLTMLGEEVDRETAIDALIGYVPVFLADDEKIQGTIDSNSSREGDSALERFTRSNHEHNIEQNEKYSGLNATRDALVASLVAYGDRDCVQALGDILTQVRVREELSPAFRAFIADGTQMSIELAVTFLERCDEYLEWRTDSSSVIKKEGSARPPSQVSNKSDWKKRRKKLAKETLEFWEERTEQEAEWIEGIHKELVAFAKANSEHKPPLRLDGKGWRRWAKKALPDLPPSGSEGD